MSLSKALLSPSCEGSQGTSGKRLRESHLQVALGDMMVILAQERVDILDALLLSIAEVLDADGDLLDLVVREVQSKLLDS